ncbi:hypothetical protein [Brevibacillus sp. SYSU BS000544]|uniref:hypothetical protein n=1 Tax=Brevibacillus sp. SYSU BS000544 TaxID=3416443 RepID=UPI003CE4A12B
MDNYCCCYLVPVRKLSIVSHELNRLGFSFVWERAGMEEVAVIVPEITSRNYFQIKTQLHLC